MIRKRSALSYIRISRERSHPSTTVPESYPLLATQFFFPIRNNSNATNRAPHFNQCSTTSSNAKTERNCNSTSTVHEEGKHHRHMRFGASELYHTCGERLEGGGRRGRRRRGRFRGGRSRLLRRRGGLTLSLAHGGAQRERERAAANLVSTRQWQRE